MNDEYLPVIVNSPVSSRSSDAEKKTATSKIKFLFGSIVWTILVIFITHLTIDTIRQHNSYQLHEYVFDKMTTGFSIFANPDQENFKSLDEIELFEKLTSDEAGSLQEYEDLLERFFIESSGITQQQSELLYKFYKIKLAGHISKTLNEYNKLDKDKCSGFIGCALNKRLEYRQLLQEDLKLALLERQVIFLKKIKQIMISTEDQIPKDYSEDKQFNPRIYQKDKWI